MLTPEQSSNKTDIVLSDAINQKYYPSLNGLRAVSILLVVMSHLNLHSSSATYAILFNGGLGVNIFFVISGFLITTLCLKEKYSTGDISLKSFYIRRILRIFPVAYLYVLVVFILNYVFHLQIAWFQFIGAMFYIMNLNYFRATQFSWFFGHYWSLANEEQFYLVFPYVLKKNSTVFTWVNLFIVFILPLLCLLQYFIPVLNQGVLYGFTHYIIKFQAISIGCLFSIFTFKKKFDKQWLRKYKVIGNLVGLFLIFYLNYDPFYTTKAVFINLLISAITGYIIISNIIPSRDVIFRFFNFKIMSFIGVLSYSIYIWQQIFTSKEPNLPWFLVTFPYNVPFIIVVPLLSYYLYEKHFLKLKGRFTKLKGKNATENLVV